jgi:hypothetical protein
MNASMTEHIAGQERTVHALINRKRGNHIAREHNFQAAAQHQPAADAQAALCRAHQILPFRHGITSLSMSFPHSSTSERR